MRILSPLLLLYFTCVSAIANEAYVIQQKSKSSGVFLVYLNSNQIKITYLQKKIEVYASKPDYKVTLINNKNKKYFVTTIPECLDVSGQGLVYKSFLVGGQHFKDKNYWLKTGTFKQDGIEALSYKFKYEKKYLQEPQTIENMSVGQFNGICQEFVELHSNLNGLPQMSSLILSISAHDTVGNSFYIISTPSIKKQNMNIVKPCVSNYKLAKSYNDFNDLQVKSQAINDLINFTK